MAIDNISKAMPVFQKNTKTTAKVEAQVEEKNKPYTVFKDEETGVEANKSGSASSEHLKSAISQANNKIKDTRTRCEFAYHEESHRISIKVFNRQTNEVIREIPAEETLEMIEKIYELAGLLVDEKR